MSAIFSAAVVGNAVVSKLKFAPGGHSAGVGYVKAASQEDWTERLQGRPLKRSSAVQL